MDRDEIRRQVQADWEARTAQLYGACIEAFCRACERRGLKAGALPVGAVVAVPDFADTTIEVPRHRLLEIIKASPYPEHAEQQVDILAKIIANSLPEDLDQHLAEGAFLERMETMRQLLLGDLNRVLKTLPSRRKSIEGLLTSLTPTALAASLRSGLSHLEQAEVFAMAYKTFLQKQAPNGPSPFTAKGSRRKSLIDSVEWNPLLIALARFFEEQGVPYTEARLQTARAMAAVFPGTWGPIPEKGKTVAGNAEAIRHRLDRLPHLKRNP